MQVKERERGRAGRREGNSQVEWGTPGVGPESRVTLRPTLGPRTVVHQIAALWCVRIIYLHDPIGMAGPDTVVRWAVEKFLPCPCPSTV